MRSYNDGGAQAYTPSPDTFLSLEAIAPKYDELRDLAGEILSGPMSIKLRLWEDGEVEMRASHEHGYADSDVRHRTVLRYHSRTGEVIGGVFETGGSEKTLLHKETVADFGSL